MPAAQGAARPANRWAQLAFGVVCMMMIANLQYSWTLFVQPMSKAHGWAIADIQLAFSIFIALETWSTPGAGWIADHLGARRGPAVVVFAGGLLVAIGWVVNAFAGQLWLLFLGAALSGIGGGGIYATCVGNAVKWWRNRRGLAVGITAAGFGAGSALTIIPVKLTIDAHGYSAAFFWFGIAQGAVVCLLAFLLRAPRPGEVPTTAPLRLPQTAASMTPKAVVASPVFWLLYGMFVAVSASGLMATAQIALIARSYGIANTPLIFGGTTLAVALVFDNVMNGAARPAFGYLSDRIGREVTMAIAFSLGAVAYWLLGSLGSSPWAFVLCAGLIFFTWGEIFSLFPSTCTDSFGARYATVNASLLYTAKGTSAFLVPLANVIESATGSWRAVFIAAAAMNVVVVLLALFVLRPMRRAHHAAATEAQTLSAK
ncbi:oxalate/formate MFS antiporter [Rhodopila globiformis]|uniref:Oxalate/formate MFS antiporter n=1 Tax=Rhodopila globiformis TaxID=1071 RepID=A0A2S6NKW4_RHOGL|nr:oxalate/formate MFS antiporter [Rhodopila globiformis]PPQ35800.1 oxalate/formate MFS antiporter [Rhodopila globiformis]